MIRELYTGLYKHFKEINSDGEEMVYYVIDVCKDTETDEVKVYYQEMYGEKIRYVREINMFMSLVDKEKYPNSKQEFRFTKMTKEEIDLWAKRNKVSVQVMETLQSIPERLLTLINI